jgi:hypothetical protein
MVMASELMFLLIESVQTFTDDGRQIAGIISFAGSKVSSPTVKMRAFTVGLMAHPL